jgi:hypothetical protein
MKSVLSVCGQHSRLMIQKVFVQLFVELRRITATCISNFFLPFCHPDRVKICTTLLVGDLASVGRSDEVA